MLEITPVTLKEAFAFIAEHHRHHEPPQGALFAVGVSTPRGEKGELAICGVAVIGRPVSRHEDKNGWTVEVTRVATDGSKYACSALYGAAWRAARAMGYKRIITYTLQTESGTSLVASGWKIIGECKGGSWSRENRPRVDTHPTQEKFKWEKK